MASGDLEIYSLMDREPVEIGRSWDVGTERGERVIVLAMLYHLKFMKVGCGSAI